MRKLFVVHAPADEYSYYLVKNTSDGLSPYTWHLAGYGLQAAARFYSKSAALKVINAGFRNAGGHPAGVAEVTVRPAYCVATRGGEKVYWLCPDWQFRESLKWRFGPRKSYSAQRFGTAGVAQAAAEKVRLPQGAGTIHVMKTVEVVYVS